MLSLTNPVKACESALFEGWYWQVWLWTPYLIDPQCIFGIHATVRESAMHFFPFVYFFNWNVRVEYVCTLHYITGMLYSRKCCNLGILLDIHIAIVLCCSWYARIMYVYAALRWSTMFFIIEFLILWVVLYNILSQFTCARYIILLQCYIIESVVDWTCPRQYIQLPACATDDVPHKAYYFSAPAQHTTRDFHLESKLLVQLHVWKTLLTSLIRARIGRIAHLASCLVCNLMYCTINNLACTTE